MLGEHRIIHSKDLVKSHTGIISAMAMRLTLLISLPIVDLGILDVTLIASLVDSRPTDT